MKSLQDIVMPYPERFFILGRSSDETNVAVYGITGRSPSSQAGKLVQKLKVENRGLHSTTIFVEPTDSQLLKKGNADLLVYPAMIIPELRNEIAVSNGKQTDDVSRKMHYKPEEFLPSFIGESIEVHIPWQSAEDAVEEVYKAFAPREGAVDFRVAVAAGYVNSYHSDSEIRNRYG